MRPPPPPLSREEFHRRRAQLLAEGRPLTLRNIEPELAQWVEEQRAPRLLALLAPAILVVAAFLLALICAARALAD